MRLKMDVTKFIRLVRGHKCLWDPTDSSYHLRDSQRGAWRTVSAEMEILSIDELKKKWRGLRDTFGKELRKHDSKSSQAATEEPKSKWPYFKLLLFLRCTMSRREFRSIPGTSEVSNEVKDTVANTSSNTFINTMLDASEVSEAANNGTDSDYVPKDTIPDKTEISDSENDKKPKTISKTPLQLSVPSSELPSESAPKLESLFKRKLKRHHPADISTRLLKIAAELNSFQSGKNDTDAQFLMSLHPFLKDVPKHRKLVVRGKLQQVLIDEQNSGSAMQYCSIDYSSDSDLENNST